VSQKVLHGGRDAIWGVAQGRQQPVPVRAAFPSGRGPQKRGREGRGAGDGYLDDGAAETFRGGVEEPQSDHSSHQQIIAGRGQSVPQPRQLLDGCAQAGIIFPFFHRQQVYGRPRGRGDAGGEQRGGMVAGGLV